MVNRLVMKFLWNGIVTVPLLLWFTDATVLSALLVSASLSLIAFFAGDQWILRETNNIAATIADIGLAALYLWMGAVYLNWDLSHGELMLTATVLGIVEWFYHGWLLDDDRADIAKDG